MQRCDPIQVVRMCRDEHIWCRTATVLVSNKCILSKGKTHCLLFLIISLSSNPILSLNLDSFKGFNKQFHTSYWDTFVYHWSFFMFKFTLCQFDAVVEADCLSAGAFSDVRRPSVCFIVPETLNLWWYERSQVRSLGTKVHADASGGQSISWFWIEIKYLTIALVLYFKIFALRLEWVIRAVVE